MSADLEILGFEPEVFAALNGRDIAIRARIIEKADGNIEQSGRYLNLCLTTADAMRLLSLLLAVQQRFGLPTPKATLIDVPPACERN